MAPSTIGVSTPSSLAGHGWMRGASPQARNSFSGVHGGRDASSRDETTSRDLDTAKRTWLELRRLVYAMEHNEAPTNQSWRSLLMRAERAQMLWQQVTASSLFSAQHSSVQQEMLADLEERVQRVCERASELAMERQLKEEGEDGETKDPIKRIFFSARASAAAKDSEDHSHQETVDSSSGSHEESERDTENVLLSDPPRRQVNPPDSHSVEELQKAQREQMEEAISQMAAQMKAETERIHTTLRGQNQDLLSNMEDVAEENVRQVTEVAKDVTEHVSKGWSRTIGTWTMLFATIGAFIFCLMTIVMIPKPKSSRYFDRPLKMETTTGRVDHATPPTLAEPAQEACELDMYGNCIPEKGASDRVSREEAAEEVKVAKEDGFGVFTEENRQKTPPKANSRDVDDGFGIFTEENRVKPQHKAKQGNLDDGFGIFTEENRVKKQPEARQRGNEANSNEPPSSGDRVVLEAGSFSAGDIRSAAGRGDTELVASYLSVMPDWIDSVDENGWTSLHLAAARGDLELARVLVEAGSNLALKTAWDQTAFDIVNDFHGSSHPLALYLEEQEIEKSRRVNSASGVAEERPEHSSSSSSVGERERMAADDQESFHESPVSLEDFQVAAARGDIDSLHRVLSTHPVLVNELDTNRWSVLHVAAQAGQQESVRLLLDAGADLQARNNVGKTPYDLAFESLGENHPITEMLQND